MSGNVNYKYKTEPYQHQIDCVHYLYGKKFGALFMEMGCGKSKAAIDIVANLYLERKINAVLLIAPNTIHLQWDKEQIPEHCPVKYISNSWRGANRSVSYEKTLDMFIHTEYSALKWFCVNVEAFSTRNNLNTFKEFVKEHDTAIVLDESTTIKNPQANRSFNITYELGKLIKQGRKIAMSIPYSKYRFILTGTMVTNSPYDLWSMFEFLSHDYFGMNYYAFKNRYGIERTDIVPNTNQKYRRPISMKELYWIRSLIQQKYDISYISSETGVTESNIKHIIQNPNLKMPYKHLEELKEKIKPYSFIIRKKDCLNLPDKVYEKLTVELTAQQKKIYKQLEKEYLAMYDDKALSVQNKLGLVLRLAQVTGGFFPYDYTSIEDGEAAPKKGICAIGKNAKIEALKRDIGETDEKLIIFARFTAEIQLLEKELVKTFPEKQIECYYGKTSSHKRSKIKEAFKVGDIDILIGNPSCAGVGLNLQRAHLVYYFSNSESLYYREQSEDRTHRIGQTETVVYKDIIAVGTIDEKIHKSLREKKNLLEYFRDHTIQDFILEY
jgi:SNF2 family DNA or RNA helicase